MLVLERVWARLERRGRAHWHGTGCCEVAALPRLGGEAWFCTAVVLDGDRGECAVCPEPTDHQATATAGVAMVGCNGGEQEGNERTNENLVDADTSHTTYGDT